MIQFDCVTDNPKVFGKHITLLSKSSFFLPKGRYALLSPNPQNHKALVDLIAGVRPPRRGKVWHDGLVSWPLGRQGFVRGKPSGHQLISFICSRYSLDSTICTSFVADMISKPHYLPEPIEHWPPYLRVEFSYAMGLLPPFDIYIVEGAIPFDPCRFTRLWQALFEQRIVGRSLILSTNRPNQMIDYCMKGLVHERNGFRVEDALEQTIKRYPSRQSISEFAGASEVDSPLPGLSDGFDL